MNKDTNEGPILFYECMYYPFSNFSSFAVQYNGKLWMTSEHAYQAAKFASREIRMEIWMARSAHDAKAIAHRYHDFVTPEWDKVKVAIMTKICRAKLEQHVFVKKRLLESNKRELIENSDKDVFWGWGHNKKGQNKLGKIWMKLRSELMAL